ncbi:DUF6438 domain-containing protein [Epilithonimonas arachidiradicis]|uniref:DUF6438 domain-containing protein n=1 Tax=Epilithonimonas arachidiradicis TaxID=1617282 RepID=A0A420D9Z0_9FLAO|nr:DUF6438 domain-containing protein [Epilithonimonas arachidiradicis]RKE87770.1 hypothetical protein BXY58_1906 [Epilithonimonas arachidiradicis]GGG57741.1 hypothetical protein GCM10007332_19360 [Epilithonimonas arachidiradicis]
MKYILSLLVFIGLMSCTTSQTTQYSKIEYEVGPCFGFCPIYKITINSDRTAVLEAEHFNFSQGEGKGDFDKPREGTFKSTVSKEDYDQLIALTDAANVKSLNDKYEDKRIMDASKTNLRVYFSDGSKKGIAMSAGEKPEKLTKLITYISELKQKQQWEKIK